MAQKDDRGVFTTVAMNIIEYCRQNPQLVRLSVFMALEGQQFGGLFSGAERHETTVPHYLTRYVQQRIEDGAFKTINAQVATRLFIGAVFMFVIDREMGIIGSPPPFADNEVVEALVEVLLERLTK